MNYKVNKKEKVNFNDLDLSCASSCTLVSEEFHLSGTCMFDSGSSLSFVKESVAKQLKLRSDSQWKGFLSTLTTKNEQKFNIYIVKVRGEDNIVHKIPCLGVEEIGSKEQIHTDALNALCKVAGICRTAIDQSSGPLTLLLGTNCYRLFPRIVKAPQHERLSRKHPNIKLLYSKLSQSLFFAGQCGSQWVQSLRDETPAKSYMINARGVFTSSFRRLSDKHRKIQTIESDDDSAGTEVATQGSQVRCASLSNVSTECCTSSVDINLGEHFTDPGRDEDVVGDHYTVPRRHENIVEANQIMFKGNIYTVTGFSVNDSSCELRLKCNSSSCSIHQQINAFRDEVSLPGPPTAGLRYPAGYVNMIRGQL